MVSDTMSYEIRGEKEEGGCRGLRDAERLHFKNVIQTTKGGHRLN